MSEIVDNVTAPATGDTAATPTAPASSGAPVTPPTTQVAPQAPATGAAPEGFVPSYRIREAREAAFRHAQQEYARKEAEYSAKMAQLERQLQALVGVQPSQHTEVDAVRQQFGKIYPNLAKMEQEYEKFAQILDRVPDFEAQTEHYWTAHAAHTVDRLYNMAQTDLGVSLSDDGKATLKDNFVGWLQANPERERRYQYDPTVVDDFWKAFTSNFIEPIKRTKAAATIAREPKALPQDDASLGPVKSTPAKAKNLDERADQAWAAFKAMRKGRILSPEDE